MQLSADSWQKITDFATEISKREGCELYDLEFTGGELGRVLRVFIDRPEGVSLDDCANVSRGLNLVLDDEDVIPGGAYELEVSSPGLERKLTKPWHFERAQGRLIRVKSHSPVQWREGKAPLKSFDGFLESVDGDQLIIKKDETEIRMRLSDVEKAHIVFEASKPQKKPGKKG